MAICVLVEALLPSSDKAGSAAPKPLPKDEKGEWISNKLKALASLPGRLDVKGAEALPGIIGAILSWILKRAADVVSCVSQNLLGLVLSIRGLLYMDMLTKNEGLYYNTSYNSVFTVPQTSSNPSHAQGNEPNSLSFCSLLGV